LNLKNLVGINTYKNFLPHHNHGVPSDGGDQFPETKVKSRIEASFLALLKPLMLKFPILSHPILLFRNTIGKAVFGVSQELVRSGNWYGNDTCWRMVIDLNKILMYANSDGTLRKVNAQNRKRFISVVDGVIAGEGNGPDEPTAKHAGLLMAGTNPAAVDAACVKFMGFDYKRIKLYNNMFMISDYPIIDCVFNDLILESSNEKLCGPLKDLPAEKLVPFEPHFGWKEHIEL
jgi:hypothetical protein